jgi:hypothetical protein
MISKKGGDEDSGEKACSASSWPICLIPKARRPLFDKTLLSFARSEAVLRSVECGEHLGDL